MKIKELLNEGSFIIKNKDGKEKRFKDAKSQEAADWKNSSSPVKKPIEKYTQEWWERKEDAVGRYTDVLYPWTTIEDREIDDDLVRKLLKGSFTISAENVTDWHTGRASTKKREGVDCAAIEVNVFLHFTKEDDIGLDDEDEDGVEETDSITIARDPKNPKKLTLA